MGGDVEDAKVGEGGKSDGAGTVKIASVSSCYQVCKWDVRVADEVEEGGRVRDDLRG